MILFNQQDTRWAKETLGNTPYTIGRWGCLVTVVTMIYDYIFNSRMTPGQASKKLLFTKDGLLIWSSLKNINLKLVERVYGRNDKKIKEAYNSSDKFVALQVQNYHWVWLVGRYIPFLGYKIADPMTGTTCYTNRYKNSITGYALISKK